MGPQLPFAQQLHETKYRTNGETFREAMNRVSSALADNDEHYHDFRTILNDQRFMPGGRVQAAIGSTRTVTPYNCYVSGTIEDSFVDGSGSIMARAVEAVRTMRMGGGIGYDFSTLRPKGAPIRKLQSTSSGAVAFMDIYDACCKVVASSGHRRGAQMGVLRIDHPDIEEFIHAKQNREKLTGFNTSIAVTDEFMRCLESGKPFALRFGGETYREVDAAALWESVMRSTWDWAEPGVLFIDTINRMNNLAYCETIAATNPCAEQPLPPFGACLLGSFNLTRYLRSVEQGVEFDYEMFAKDIPHVVRAMDNVCDRAKFPLYEQEKEAQSKRRMGLGVTGLANALEAIGYPYGSAEFLQEQEKILQILAVGAYTSSVQLATEKGSFPMLNRALFANSPFLRQEMFNDIRGEIIKHGIRNSHLLSIAPAGTISMAADNISSGIEPVFAYTQERIYIGPDGPEKVELEDYGYRVFGIKGKTVKDVTVAEHLAVLAMATKHVDSAVSKTVNVPVGTSWEDFKQVYTDAWKTGCKGCATFYEGGKRGAVIESKDVAGTCHVDSVTGKKDCD